MRRCQYVFTQGFKRCKQCRNFATSHGFCSIHRNRANKEVNNISSLSRRVAASNHVISFRNLSFIGCCGMLCKQIPTDNLIREVEKYCRVMKSDDISHDIAITAKFITELTPVPLSCGCQCVIYVINVHTVICRYAGYTIPITQAGNWETIATFRVKKNPAITDTVALVAILWQLTTRQWPDAFYQWLGVDRSTSSLEEYQNIVSRRLGL
jgi:hypothetical protein